MRRYVGAARHRQRHAVEKALDRDVDRLLGRLLDQRLQPFDRLGVPARRVALLAQPVHAIPAAERVDDFLDRRAPDAEAAALRVVVLETISVEAAERAGLRDFFEENLY